MGKPTRRVTKKHIQTARRRTTKLQRWASWLIEYRVPLALLAVALVVGPALALAKCAVTKEGA